MAKPNFKAMTVDEALAYMERHRKEYIREAEDPAEGVEQYDVLIELVRHASLSPVGLPSYGFNYDDDPTAATTDQYGLRQMRFIDDLRASLIGGRIQDVREGILDGVPVCEFLYRDRTGRTKMIALVPRKVGNSVEDSFDANAYVTTPRPVKKDAL